MADYISPTASLLESNTKATTAKLDRQAAQSLKGQELLTSSANASEVQAGENKRQVVQGKQAELLQNLRDHANQALEVMQQQEASKRQEKQLKEEALRHHEENYFVMTPNTVNGIKNTIGLDFKDLQDKEVNKDVILALIGAKYKSDIAELMAGTKGGKAEKDLQKELDKIETGIKANRDKLFAISTKDLPPEVWGGEPGNVRKLAQTISSGKLGKLDPNQQAQIQQVAGYINQMKSQQQRANLIHKQLGTDPTDYTGMGLGGDTGAPKEYKTAEEVRAAFQAGQLDRASAKKILADNFGIK